MGQYVLSNEEIRKIQKIELELLIEFDRICRKNDIRYSIDGGTLLGAVRGGGFIPWDDDADVIMNRNDYTKFVGLLEKELDHNRFYFQDMMNTIGYRWGYGKLRRKGTRFVRLNQEYMPYEQGIFLDVFVCDNVPNNYLRRCLTNFHSYMYRKAFYSVVGINNEKGIKKIVYLILSQLSEDRLKSSYSKYVKKRNAEYSEWTKCLTYPACNNYFGYRREWYEDTIEIQFEGVTLMAARKYDEYLTFLYGDYMKIPDENERKTHPISELYILPEVL